MRFISTIKTIFGYSSTRMTPHASLAVFGSQGKTGIHIVNKALSQNKNIVSLVKPRHTISSTEKHTIYKGDVTNLNDVDCVYRNNYIEGTIICLGGNTNEVGSDMLTKGTTNIINSIKKYNESKKIAIVTSIGTGDSFDDPPLFFKILMKTILKDAFIDKNNQEKLFLDEKSDGYDLEFVIVRPSGLTNEEIDGFKLLVKIEFNATNEPIRYDPLSPKKILAFGKLNNKKDSKIII